MASGNDLSVSAPIGAVLAINGVILAEHQSAVSEDNIVILAVQGDISVRIIGPEALASVSSALDPIHVIVILVAVLGSLVVLIAAADILVLSNSSGLQSVDLGIVLLDLQQINGLAVLLIGDDEVLVIVIDVIISGLNVPSVVLLALVVSQDVVLLLDELQVVILGVLVIAELLSDFQIVASCEGDGAQAQSHDQTENQSNNLLHACFLQKFFCKNISFVFTVTNIP